MLNVKNFKFSVFATFSLFVACVPTLKKNGQTPLLSSVTSESMIVNDPQYSSQDYLKIINVPSAWQRGIQGQGIIVGMLDTTFWPLHPDMIGAYLNEEFRFHSAAFLKKQDYASHGSSTSAIVAARLNNGIGIVGVAPKSRLLRMDFGNPEWMGITNPNKIQQLAFGSQTNHR